jgi:hypothetical protein
MNRFLFFLLFQNTIAAFFTSYRPETVSLSSMMVVSVK